MKLSSDTITVFNSFVNTQTKATEYQSIIISGVHWFGSDKVSVNSDGLIGAKEYKIRIPVDANFNSSKYVQPKEFQSLEDKKGFFTLAEGDVIVKGAITATDTRPSHLFKKYDDVVTVVSVTDNRNAPNAKHWRVLAK